MSSVIAKGFVLARWCESFWVTCTLSLNGAGCRRFTRRAYPHSPLGCNGSLIGDVKRGQNMPVVWLRQTGLSHVHVHDYWPDAFMLYWMAKESEYFWSRSDLFHRCRSEWLASMPVNWEGQTRNVFVWTDPLTIGHDFRKGVRDVWNSARRVNRLLTQKQGMFTHQVDCYHDSRYCLRPLKRCLVFGRRPSSGARSMRLFISCQAWLIPDTQCHGSLC